MLRKPKKPTLYVGKSVFFNLSKVASEMNAIDNKMTAAYRKVGEVLKILSHYKEKLPKVRSHNLPGVVVSDMKNTYNTLIKVSKLISSRGTYIAHSIDILRKKIKTEGVYPYGKKRTRKPKTPKRSKRR